MIGEEGTRSNHVLQGEGRRYRILETIGRGGFGTVYKAELVGHGGFVKMVALKILNDAVAGVEGTQERLRDEARMLGLLRHRAIVNVDSLLQLDGRWTVVMEYVEGVDLKQLLAHGPVPVGVAIEIIQEVANALYVAYERPMGQAGPMRLLHRDIKPSNLLLSAAGEVKILDFGVARAEFESREARTSVVAFGSLGYMAPERMEGENSHSGDVYALGAVLYELIVGAPLGRTNPEPDAHDVLIDQALAKLWAVVPDEELYQIIGECVAYDATARPPARELERRLRGVRVRFSAPWLSDWAEDHVPDALAKLSMSNDERVGNVLVENSGPRSDPARGPSTPPPLPPLPEEGTLPELPPDQAGLAPRLDPLAPQDQREDEAEEQERGGALVGVAGVLAAAFGASVVIALGLGGAWMLLEDRKGEPAGERPTVGASAATTEAPKTEPVVAAAVATPDPPVTTPPPDEPATATAPETPQTTAPTTAPETPQTTAAPETPQTTAPTTAPTTATQARTAYGQVIVLGDMTGIRLFKGAKSYGAGRVPAGSYVVRSTTDSSGKSLGEVVVKANKSVTVTCKTGFPFCVVK